MDLIHSVPDTVNLEGCYNACKLLENKVENYGGEPNIYKYEDFSPKPENNSQKCNSEALQKGYDYFGISPAGNCFGLKTEDIKDLDTIEDSKCSLTERKGGNEFYDEKDGNFHNFKFACNAALLGEEKEAHSVYISKVTEVGTNIVSDCWRNLINTYPYQSPGVWLHPFVNNIRIVFTTNSQEKYHNYINDLSHANKGNPANRQVQPITIQPTEHAAVMPSSDSEKICKQGTVPPSSNYYRESFDVLNIPINNEFHLAIIVNGQSVEVYVNAELKQTIKLFGKPTFNTGQLQINPEKTPREEL